MTKQQSYDNLARLVEKFATNLNEYKVKNYNEAQARVDFINPFFELLGWDINNRKGMPESYRDVIYEDKLRIGGSVKAPDYCFTINGNRKFFVEAKKPIISLKDKIEPAYQLRRYGWSAKMPISLLTDFEELSLYDCSLKPNPYDGAFVSRLRYLTYNDYLKEFNFLWDVFSREQIEKGSLAQFINANVSKANRSSVDSEFLKSLDKWRDLLAHDLVNMNDNLDEDQLNYSLQKIVDRIVFLRICEDRGVEQDEQLFKAIKLSDVYDRLRTIFHIADQKYNSGLFDYNKDKITDNLKVSDMVLRNIIQEMYFPICPYEFSVIPVEILGHSYEQYLGKVIKITPTHDITIEEKPEVRKAGGVYYTPQYIVDYIVKNTVGKLVENKTPEEVSKLKICDPACGSGSFLLGAYQFLLNWHLDYYTKHPHKSNPVTPDGNLTTTIKKQILLNNIYGVDIDTNAVEVTKLSLMLKALEGETNASINHQLSWFHDRILPTLDDNIKSGNSLIDIDFYDNQIDFEPGMEKKIKPFNWESSFPTVFKQGGFDAVIGNPPYIRIQTMTEYLPKSVIDYYKTNFYAGQSGNIDIYVVFIEKAYNLLNGKGLLGFIVPHKFFPSQFGENLRELITKNKSINEIVHFGSNKVFEQADTYTCLLFLSSFINQDFKFVEFLNNAKLEELIQHNLILNNEYVKSSNIIHPDKSKDKWSFKAGISGNLIEKLKKMQCLKLSDYSSKIFVGLQTSADNIFVLNVKDNKYTDYHNIETFELYSKQLNKMITIEKGLIKPFLMGRDLYRYNEPIFRNYVIFPYIIDKRKAVLMTSEYIKQNFPNGWQYILDNKKALEDREKGKFKKTWWQFGRTQNITEFEQKKILIRELGDKPNMYFDTDNFYHTAKIYSLILNEDNKSNYSYFLGLLNSKLLNYFIKNTSEIWGTSHKFKTQFLNPFPIPKIPSPNSPLQKLVDNMLQLNKDLQSATLPEQKELIQQRINYTDKQIDKLVYELYELTEEEIKIVEGESN